MKLVSMANMVLLEIIKGSCRHQWGLLPKDEANKTW